MVVCCITGFGSFGSIGTNPTEALVQSLPLEDSHDVTYHTSVIMVSREHVDAWIRDTFQTLVDACVTREEKIIFIHLGVSETSTEIALERCAYNECDFRIPDVSGAQPRHVSISDADELGQSQETGVPVMALADSLERSTGRHVRVSDDPGRYVCNYLYYRSLMEYRNVSRSLEEYGSTGQRWSLFVHVPKEDCIPLDELKVIVMSLIQYCLDIV